MLSKAWNLLEAEQSNPFTSHTEPSAMKCPICPDANLVMSSRQNIEIDYCPDCRGVWLDRGELDKLIERSVSESTPPARQAAPQPYPQPHHQDSRRYDGHRKHKSFWHEIFD
jgi:Zn-finger nucleic acid-binding protein